MAKAKNSMTNDDVRRLVSMGVDANWLATEIVDAVYANKMGEVENPLGVAEDLVRAAHR